MNTASLTFRERLAEELTFDRGAFGLVVLFLLVHLATVALVVHYQGIGYAAEGPPGVDGGSAGTGAAFAAIEVAVAACLLGLALAWRYLPEWIQETLAWDAVIALYMLMGALGFAAGLLGEWIALFVVGMTAYKTLDHFELWWLVNNALVVLLAIGVAAGAATWFGPSAVIVAIVGLTVYDYVFADRKNWMFKLGESIMKLRLPVLFVVPKQWRVDWDYIVSVMGDGEDEEERLSWGIGTGDLILPALFAGAVAYSGDLLAGGVTTWAVAGVIGGTILACFRIRHKILVEGGGAGLPPLAAGSVGGYLVAVLPWGVMG